MTYWLVLTARTDPTGVSNNSQWAEAGKDGADGGSYLVQTDTGWLEVATGDRGFELDGHGTRLLTKAGATIASVPDNAWTLALLALVSVPLIVVGRLKARGHSSV